jgi:ankyrin repeat protein
VQGISVNSVNSIGQTALHIAVTNDEIELVDLLLEYVFKSTSIDIELTLCHRMQILTFKIPSEVMHFILLHHVEAPLAWNYF